MLACNFDNGMRLKSAIIFCKRGPFLLMRYSSKRRGPGRSPGPRSVACLRKTRVKTTLDEGVGWFTSGMVEKNWFLIGGLF